MEGIVAGRDGGGIAASRDRVAALASPPIPKHPVHSCMEHAAAL